MEKSAEVWRVGAEVWVWRVGVWIFFSSSFFAKVYKISKDLKVSFPKHPAEFSVFSF